ncbi:MAG: hypothetical protein HUU18_07520 [Phycisphaerales bacterium]|nr:hypothetical protein [Phycisphaerales bacterium]
MQTSRSWVPSKERHRGATQIEDERDGEENCRHVDRALISVRALDDPPLRAPFQAPKESSRIDDVRVGKGVDRHFDRYDAPLMQEPTRPKSRHTDDIKHDEEQAGPQRIAAIPHFKPIFLGRLRQKPP